MSERPRVPGPAERALLDHIAACGPHVYEHDPESFAAVCMCGLHYVVHIRAWPEIEHVRTEGY